MLFVSFRHTASRQQAAGVIVGALAVPQPQHPARRAREPALMRCASGVENLTTPLATPGKLASSAFTFVSRDFFPVPRTTT